MGNSPLYVLSCILVWMLGIMSVWKSRNNVNFVSRNGVIVAMFSILYLCVFAFYDTDYYHYMEIFHSVYRGEIFHIEEAYLPIAIFANDNYVIFRLCIWGGAVLFALLAFKRFELPMSLVTLFFLSVVVLKFGYARVSLALAMATYGYSLIIKPISHRILSCFFGVAIVYVASFFHNSAIFYVLVLMLSLIAPNAGKKSIIGLACIYPIMIYIFQQYGGELILEYINNEENAQGALSYVYGDFYGYQGVGVRIRTFLERVPFFISLFLAIYIRWKGIHNTMPYYMKIVINLCIFAILSALMFSFKTSVNTYTFYYRFLYFAMLPMVSLVVYCLVNRLALRIVSLIFWSGLISTSFNLLYSLYCSI